MYSIYSIKYENPRILKHVESLPRKDRKAILDTIDDRLKHFSPFTRGIKYVKTLNRYRLRQGDYRIIFSVDSKTRTIIVHAIVDRKEAY